MTSDNFINLCKQIIVHYYIDNTELKPCYNDVQVVWQCKTLQNYKAILMVKIADQRIFECSFNGDKEELYLDVYNKEYNHKYEYGKLYNK